MRFTSRRRSEPAINLMSLIDIMFTVMLFLLLSTTFSRFTRVSVTLPDATTGEVPPADERPIRIAVDADGTIHMGETPMTLESLGLALDAVEDKDAAVVLLAADTTVEHGQVVAIMDLVRRAGISQMAFETLSRSNPLGSVR